MTTAQESPRRWLQFSLKSIFVLMLVVAAFFGGMAVQRRQMEQALAAEELVRANEQREVLQFFLQQAVSTSPANPPSPVTSGGDLSAE